MNSVFTWIADVLLVIISLSFFQILIPSSNMEGYLKYIFSLIVMAMIIEPVLSVINQII